MFDEIKITCISTSEYKIINIWDCGLSVHDLNIVTEFYENHNDFRIEILEPSI
jgi:hypothetical protein